MNISRGRHLSGILGIGEDPSLQLAGVGVVDDVVQIRLVCAQGACVTYYCADEARRVVTDLIDWSKQWTPQGLSEAG